jgi:hypothetical protein
MLNIGLFCMQKNMIVGMTVSKLKNDLVVY